MSTLAASLLAWLILAALTAYALGPILRAGREYREAFDAETVRLADEDEAMAVARRPMKETAAFIAEAYIEIEQNDGGSGMSRCACGCGEFLSDGLRYRRGHNGRRPLEERFWEKVGKAAGCWEWLGSRTSDGYGNFRIGQGSWDYAHRIAYKWLIGDIPSGLVIDHLCRNRGCCNPAHLEAVPQRENTRRGLAPYGLRTTCKRGHDITEVSNVRITSAGHRQCRQCDAIREGQRAARRKATA